MLSQLRVYISNNVVFLFFCEIFCVARSMFLVKCNLKFWWKVTLLEKKFVFLLCAKYMCSVV